MANIKQKTKRNDKLVDWWSLVHFVNAAILCALFGPVVAIIVTYLWEPLEIFVISPIVARFGVLFGHETLKNSLSDIFFDTAGVLAVLAVQALL